MSAIALCAEYQRLGKEYRQHRVLRVSFWVKLAFIIVEVALAIGFGITNEIAQNTAAILEWVIALIFTFWVLSFLVDLLPAVTKNRRLKGRYGDRAAAPEHGPGLEMAEGGVAADDGGQQHPGYYRPARSEGSAAMEPSRNF